MLTLLLLLVLGALLGQFLARRELLRRIERLERELARQRTELGALRGGELKVLRPDPPPGTSPEPAPAAPLTPLPPADPFSPRPHAPRRLPEARSVFAVGGAVLTLLGLGFVLSQLQSAGLLTPAVQLAAALALAAALYALSGRVGGVVGQMLRGLGYGVAALCVGAMFQAGVLEAVGLPASALALALAGLLGAAVGAHALHRGELPAVAVALGGTTLAVWLLADDLARDLGGGGLLPAQLALLAVALATLRVVRRAGPGSAPLLGLLPLGMAGLLVSGEHHGQPGEPALWLVQALLPGALLTGWAWPGAAGWAAGTLLGALWVAALALVGAPGALPVLALGSLGLFAAATPAGRRAPLGQAAVLGALLAGGLWVLTLWGERAGLPLRLLPLALASALYGGWAGVRVWRGLSAALAGALLLWAGAGPLAVALLAAVAGGAGGLLLGGRAGAAVLGAAALAAGLGWDLGAAALALAAALLAVALLAVTGWSALAPAPASRAGARVAGALAGAGALLTLAVLLNAALRGPDTPPALALASGAALLLFASLRGWSGQAVVRLWRLPRPLPAQAGELLACALWLLGVALALPAGTAPWSLTALAAALALALGLAGARLPALLAALAGLGLLGGLLAPLAPGLASGLPAWLGGVGLLLAWSAGRAEGGVGTRWPRGLPLRLPPARELTVRWALAVALAFAGAELLAGRVTGGYLATLPGTAALLLPGLLALGLGQRRGLAGVWWVGLTAFGLGAARLVLDAEGLGLAAQGLGLTVVGLLLLAIGQFAPGLRRGPAGG